MFRRLITWPKLQFLALVELFLLPGLAIFLPWPLCFKVFRFATRFDVLYREPVHRGLAQAEQLGYVQGEHRDWAQYLRLVRLVDQADLFLVKTRSNAWLQRYVVVEGQWPDADKAGFLCCFHWGAGIWSLRHARAAGLKPHMMLARFDRRQYADQPMVLINAWMRIAGVAGTTGRPTIDPVGARQNIQAVLAAHEQVSVVLDVPADSVRSSSSVTLLSKTAYVASGLLGIAVEQQVPITLFSMDIDMHTGNRHLKIKPVGIFDTLEHAMDSVFSDLDRLIAEAPHLWHFWGEAPRFFRRPDC